MQTDNASDQAVSNHDVMADYDWMELCPECQAEPYTAVPVGPPDNYVWQCSNGCDLTNYFDCEECWELFDTGEFEGPLCEYCQEEEEEVDA